MGCGVRHAGGGVCAPAARERDGAREGQSADGREAERRQWGGQSSRLPREDAPSWHESGCFPIQRGDLRQRHAPSRRLRHRPGAHHRLLLRHRQRQRMLHVPKRYQSCGTVIKNPAYSRIWDFFIGKHFPSLPPCVGSSYSDFIKQAVSEANTLLGGKAQKKERLTESVVFDD